MSVSLPPCIVLIGNYRNARLCLHIEQLGNYKLHGNTHAHLLRLFFLYIEIYVEIQDSIVMSLSLLLSELVPKFML